MPYTSYLPFLPHFFIKKDPAYTRKASRKWRADFLTLLSPETLEASLDFLKG
ncbi:hypothetical protein HMPREF0813_00497 [Streptococcus anginosus F0211]|uniref:Uncharacterized protein n=1 Tax=Streptococcus anginosus F0211 TaxID=706437 RepID=E6IZT0_STRAP|nr:hypothetical protein HMPREF0813_00497 [Streptococcus anginosus F0211]